MSPRQIFAYRDFAIRNKERDLGLSLNMNAIASQGAGKDIKETVERLLKDD
jgi:hypothetical protein